MAAQSILAKNKPLNSTITSVVSTFVFTALVSLITATSFAQDSFSELELKSNQIEKLGAKFEVITFATDGRRLKPVFSDSQNSTQKQFRRIQSKFSSTSSSGSGGTWATNGTNATSKIACGFGRTGDRIGRPGVFWLTIEDITPTGAVATVEASKAGGILINYTTNDGAYSFRFRQRSKSGEVYCRETTKSAAFAASARSFDAFCQQNSQFVRKRVEPLFKFVGLGQLSNRFADDIAKNVLLSFQPVDQERLKNFQKAIKGLNADSFDEREAAMKALKGNFKTWSNLIQSSINDDKHSVETRTRLKKIFLKSATEQEKSDLEIAQEGKLSDDATYLIWLLEQSESNKLEVTPDIKKLLASKIEKLTGENHGDDLKKWQAWVSKFESSNAIKPKPTLSNSEMLELEGPLEEVTHHIDKLVRLQIKQGQLKINREDSAAAFGGKSLKEKIQKVKKQIKESNLPESWFDEGGKYAFVTTEYPQVLFKLMTEEFNKANQPKEAEIRYYMPDTLTFNREFKNSNLRASLKFHPEPKGGFRMMGGMGDPKPPKKEFFEFAIGQSTPGFVRNFNYRELNDGSLILTLEYPNKDGMLKIVQGNDSNFGQEDHLVVFDIRGPVAKVFKAKSFSKFIAENENYFDEFFSPVLEKLSIKIIEEP